LILPHKQNQPIRTQTSEETIIKLTKRNAFKKTGPFLRLKQTPAIQ